MEGDGIIQLAETAIERGQRMHDLARELFPICRSLTGDGVRQTLGILKREIPELQIHEVPSGTPCFDWVVPDEWNIRDAYILGPNGDKIVDFRRNNLHVVGYSEPVDASLDLEALRPHLYSLPDQPEAIPYVTSYYKRRWGFCLTHRQLSVLQPGTYRVRVDSTLGPGKLTYGEVRLPGESQAELFLSTYLCHPSMANNELSGPVVTAEIVRWLKSRDRRFSVRVVFIPETIGSILYISRHLEELRRRMAVGFNVTCIGDERAYSYLPTRLGDTQSDRAACHALRHHVGEFRRYSFLDRGSDERQYCSPGVDLPVASIMRSKYAEYPEYHTSLDDLTLVTPAGLAGGFAALSKAILAAEFNRTYVATIPCEPNLGRRGLYPTLSTRDTAAIVKPMMTVLAYSDGSHDLMAIADLLGLPIWTLAPIAEKLLQNGLLRIVDTGMEERNRMNGGKE